MICTTAFEEAQMIREAGKKRTDIEDFTPIESDPPKHGLSDLVPSEKNPNLGKNSQKNDKA